MEQELSDWRLYKRTCTPKKTLEYIPFEAYTTHETKWGLKTSAYTKRKMKLI